MSLSSFEPIPAIYAIGLNYRQHAIESNAPIPTRPVVFMKPPSSAISDGETIWLPASSQKVDYEVELAVIIGKTCKNATRETALSFVGGYTAANDVSARDWQLEWGGSQWIRGKSFDSFTPLGPRFVPASEIHNPNALSLKTILNGEVVQDWNTSDMIFDVPQIIEFLSHETTLLPGTVILTGTPQGVGMARTPPLWLKEGDLVTVEIETIGALSNPVKNAR